MRRLPLSLRYLLRIYILGIVFFTFFRLVFLFKSRVALAQIPLLITCKALFMGFRFDTVISGYILALPIVILTLADFGRFLYKPVLLWVHVLLCILFVTAFFICAADVPFFLAYNNRLNYSVLNWTDSPMFMAKMVFTEWSYLVYLLLFILVAVIYVLRANKIYKRFNYEFRSDVPKPKFWMLPISLLAMALLFIGIRGRVEQKSPIMVGTAYFSNYDLANQAGLNPVYTFINSCFEALKDENKYLHLMNDREALKNVQDYLHVVPSKYNSPIARYVSGYVQPVKHNVVIVLMEGMSAGFMRHGNNTKGLTPVLDSIADKGYYFSNCYSAGVHTFNGIFSTLYSFPALMARHTMVGAVIPHYSGLPYVMKQYGYQNVYFTTHDEQFDNVGGFLTSNYFDRIVSQKDYPASAVVSALGVPDHFMFDEAIPVFNTYAAAQKTFFACLMTGSNHAPYTVPDGIPFTPAHPDVRDGTVEYADWAIGHFLSVASKQPWYGNTIFVFVADHGAFDAEGASFGDMPYSLNHIPLIIYSPLLSSAPKTYTQPCGQIDIFPTLCALLHFSYINNTMGQDVFSQPRPYMYFSADDKLAVADSSDFYLWHTDGREALYNFSNPQQDVLGAHATQAGNMKRYAFSMLQSTEWLLQNGMSKPAK